MKNIVVILGSLWRKLFPLVQKKRQWSWRYYDRMGIRLDISGGKIRFLDAELEFPEQVGLNSSTPIFGTGPEADDAAAKWSRSCADRSKSRKVILANDGTLPEFCWLIEASGLFKSKL